MHCEILSKHASKRIIERSIAQDIWDVFIQNADIEIPTKGNAAKIMLSTNAAQLLSKQGLISKEILSRAQRLCAIIRDGVVITTYRRPTKKSFNKRFIPNIAEVWA